MENHCFRPRPESESQLHELRLLRELKDLVSFPFSETLLQFYLPCICLLGRENQLTLSKEVDLWKEPVKDKPVDILVGPTKVSKDLATLNF